MTNGTMTISERLLTVGLARVRYGVILGEDDSFLREVLENGAGGGDLTRKACQPSMFPIL